jgi:hypothetical protein
MDQKLVNSLSQYFEKVADFSEQVQKFADNQNQYFEKESAVKSASFSQTKDRAERLAFALSAAHLPSGQTVISGHNQVKQAELMLNDHTGSLDILEMLVNRIEKDSQKAASYDVGKVTSESVKKKGPSKEDILLSVL